jgi:hypothetical protein
MISTSSSLVAVLVAGCCGYLLGRWRGEPPRRGAGPCPKCGGIHDTADPRAGCPDHPVDDENLRRQLEQLNRAAKKRRD